MERPSGTVTFLFTDIEGSTRRWEGTPQAMRTALARHDAILEDAISSHGGFVFSRMGDGMAAAFASAHDCLEAALQTQRGLAAEPWPEEIGGLIVRMGAHTGEGVLVDGQYLNQPLNRCARLMAIAHGGQVVISGATEPLVRGSLPEEVAPVDLGEHRLRDLSEPVRVFQVTHPELAADFAPLRSLDSYLGNLPLQVSSFVGRERELARGTEALRTSRMVTLTGVGGVGKTRLAVQLAAEVLSGFKDGAWLVELAPVRDPDGVAEAVASVFGVGPRAGQSIEDALVEFFATKQLLLVLDNCEHLLDVVGDLVERMERSCASLVVLATSREGLGLDGEQNLAVPSLGSPSADADLDEIVRADAVALFIERSQRVDSDFGLTTENASAVVQICRRLDGIPLALELAAAQVRAMTPSELLSGLDHRFETLSGGRRRAIERHQTLRAAFDWSYDLLSAPERRLLARLSVFAGGCTRESAEAVCAGDPIEATKVFRLLSGLVERSLVVAERDGPDTRYRLLEMIREYAEERLAEAGETMAVRQRHAEHYVDLMATLVTESEGPDQIKATRRAGMEQENLTAAMAHAVDVGDVDLALRGLTASWIVGWVLGFGLR